ncbi:hypothetical protein HPB47_020263, partial [Ixodes persulcatus]
MSQLPKERTQQSLWCWCARDLPRPAKHQRTFQLFLSSRRKRRALKRSREDGQGTMTQTSMVHEDPRKDEMTAPLYTSSAAAELVLRDRKRLKNRSECIIEIRYNRRLNLIAVDTRNGQTTRALLDRKKLCGIPVRTYEPLPRHYAVGVITEVDTTLSEADVWKHLRSPENRVARLRQFGQSSTMKISFCGTTLPNFVYLGPVRHPVTLFKERPIQCRKCCRYEHREASCKNPPVCNRYSGTHPDTESCTAQEKCVNCGEAHSAKSPSCPKWWKERKTFNYARHHAVDFRTVKVALQEPNAPNPTKGSDEFPPLPQMSVAGGTGKQ